MHVLDNLWHSDLMPEKNRILDKNACNAILRQLAAEEDTLYQLLPKDRLQIFEDYQQVQDKRVSMCEQNAFISGVRFGAKLMLDILGDHP